MVVHTSNSNYLELVGGLLSKPIPGKNMKLYLKSKLSKMTGGLA
jgi:hypothetical protein